MTEKIGHREGKVYTLVIQQANIGYHCISWTVFTTTDIVVKQWGGKRQIINKRDQ